MIEADRSYLSLKAVSIAAVRQALEKASILFLSSGTIVEGVGFAKPLK